MLDIQRVVWSRNALPNSLGIYSTISSAGAAMLTAGCSSAESVPTSGTSCGMLPSSGCLLYCYGNIILFVFTCHSKLKNLTYYFHLIDVHMKKGAIMPYLAEALITLIANIHFLMFVHTPVGNENLFFATQKSQSSRFTDDIAGLHLRMNVFFFEWCFHCLNRILLIQYAMVGVGGYSGDFYTGFSE